MAFTAIAAGQSERALTNVTLIPGWYLLEGPARIGKMRGCTREFSTPKAPFDPASNRPGTIWLALFFYAIVSGSNIKFLTRKISLFVKPQTKKSGARARGNSAGL
jgi:hypothetical protein